VNVGVAYGSPVDRVRDLLLEEAGRHGLVLRNPEPEVYFEDFASDALNFSLQYWLDLPRTPDSRRVASDLRYMIEKSFTEAGIAIAFPQRDVHLDASRPIPVQVVAGTDGGGR
jgi:small-conductance mechanosensitive channel